MGERSERATSFGAHADTYERARPDYPAAAVRWLLESCPAGARVADVGAGTGKLTRALAHAGARVTAIDPDAEMLEKLRATLPEVETKVGQGENIPLPDSSLDLVTFGQAWHWVDPVAASEEAARVLAPGGALGLVWNIRDSSEPWVARMTAIMTPSDAEALIDGGGPRIEEPFARIEHASWSWAAELGREDLLRLARSRSYVITAPRAERERIERELSLLFDELGLDSGATIALPYTTHVFRAVRP